jgi:pimeloyl-ACP methyl ester carboxylesterase
LLLAGLAIVPLGGAAGGELPLGECTLAGGIEARCGRLTVPENRAVEKGRTISLRVAVVPARDRGARPDPLVYITGGPGGSAIADAAGLRTVFWDMNASRDLVLVDQRGTGGSNPLECRPPRRGAEPADARGVRAYVRACLATLGADPRRYTTVPAMDDLAAVLRALGYARVNLYAISYGATAAQYFLHQHPELVRTAILDGATLLDVPIFELWGRNGQRALTSILARCASDRGCAAAYPRVRSEVFEVIASLRRKPVRVGETRIDAATAAGVVQTLSRSPEGASQIPWIAHRAREGDWVPLLLALDQQAAGAGTRQQVMFWSIVCNEPWARRSTSRSAALSKATYLAEDAAAGARLGAAVCSAFPRVPQPAWSRLRVRSDAPVLLVAGGDDPQDPPANVAGARRELPNSLTVVVPGAGHGSVQLGCLPALARRFVERGSAAGLDTRCAARYRPPPFYVAP